MNPIKPILTQLPILTQSLRSASIASIIPISMIAICGPVGAAHELDQEFPVVNDPVVTDPVVIDPAIIDPVLTNSVLTNSVVTEGTKPQRDLTQKINIPEYVSPLLSYTKYVESSGPEWKSANDRVGEIGGWRSYAREAYQQERQEKEEQELAMEQKALKSTATLPTAAAPLPIADAPAAELTAAESQGIEGEEELWKEVTITESKGTNTAVSQTTNTAVSQGTNVAVSQTTNAAVSQTTNAAESQIIINTAESERIRGENLWKKLNTSPGKDK